METYQRVAVEEIDRKEKNLYLSMSPRMLLLKH